MTFLVATNITTINNIFPKYRHKRFSTCYSGLLDFKQWLSDDNGKDVCMESTGKYWVPVWNVPEAAYMNVVIANPKWASAVKGNKDDRKDEFTLEYDRLASHYEKLTARITAIQREKDDREYRAKRISLFMGVLAGR